MAPRIERAAPDDFPAVLGLLEASHLPTDGLPGRHVSALVAREDGEVVASAALEVYRDGALLRSVAVREGHRGRGLGGRMTQAALDLAAELGAPAVYLLTTTAAAFFPRFGFAPLTREAVPGGVKASVEFTTACPASAAVLWKPLVTPDRA